MLRFQLWIGHRQNRRITTREIAVELSIRKGIGKTIIHENICYGKVCAMWVPKYLSDSQKTSRISVYLTYLLKYANERIDFVANIATCNETWCHHFDLTSRRMTMERRHPSSPRPKKAQSAQIAGKVIFSLFQRQMTTTYRVSITEIKSEC